jgi:hypothetical protein
MPRNTRVGSIGAICVAAPAAVLLAILTGCAGAARVSPRDPGSSSPPWKQLCLGCLPIRIAPADTRLAASVLDLPLTLVDGLPLLEVRINDQGPFRVLLDTGVESAAFLTPRAVRLLALPDEGASRVVGITGETAEAGVRVRRVHRLEIYGVEFRDFPALEVPGLERFRGLDGFLGMALFWDCLLTIDYPAERMRITRGALPEPDGREHLPLAAGTILPVTNLTLGPVQTPVLIDSGDNRGLTVTRDIARRLAFSHGPVDSDSFTLGLVGAAYRTRVGRLAADAALGRHLFERPVVDIAALNRIGAKALAHFAVTLDRRRNVVRFAREARDAIPSPPERTLGIVFLLTPDGPVVYDLIPGTPAVALDIRPGDRLLSVEGYDVDLLSPEERKTLIADRNEVALVLLRGDQHIEVRVPVVDLP